MLIIIPSAVLSVASSNFNSLKATYHNPMASSSASSRFCNVNAFVAEDGGAATASGTASSRVAASAAATTDARGLLYNFPPKVIKDIIDNPRSPILSFSPRKDKALLLKRGPLPTLSDLATPQHGLAGVRIDAKSNSQSDTPFYTGISIRFLLNDDGSVRENIPGTEREISGLPEGARICFVKWSPDEKKLCFAIRDKEVEGSSSSSSLLRVWIADVETGIAKPLFQSQDKFYLNAVFGNFVWVDDSTLLVCTIPLDRGEPPKKPLVPAGPKIQSNEEKERIQARTHQDLLKDEYDEDLFDYYATSRLVLVSLDGINKGVGSPAIYTSMVPSPDRKYILISSIHRPYSFTVPCSKFPKTVELWHADGRLVRQICDLPLAENIPIAFESVRKGMRSLNWRADTPSSLYWVETQDGGDAKEPASPRDIIYTQPAELLGNGQPTVLLRLDLRYRGILWCDDSLALVKESWHNTRETRTWVISPGSKDAIPRVLFERSSEDAYKDPGSPMLRMSDFGTDIIAKVKKPDDHQCNYILLKGIGASEEGNIPFLDLFDIDTKNNERIWLSDEKNYYKSVFALMSDQTTGELSLDKLKILVSKESQTENTQHYLLSWPEKIPYQITDFSHPYPLLASLQKEMIKYERNDKVPLTATLYLPPGYVPERDGPLPCIFWAYPEEFKSKEAAGQVRGSPNAFTEIGPTSPLLWLSRRFAILHNPTIPIIGEGTANENDSYIEQLVAGAEAAVGKVVSMGVAERGKIAVGGHSYGAFMAANLLAHAPHLFSCGFARSGAYNRTLTPFGFQMEQRNIWEAKDVYLNMSPFLLADKIKNPILLIHGEQDRNSGTLTMQSVRFFDALKGNAAPCRLVILPFEGHRYKARENIMHLAWETDRWLEKYCRKRYRQCSSRWP